MQETKRHRFDFCIGKIPWKRAWQPTPVLLLGESHGHRSLVSFGPQGCKELDTIEATEYTCTQNYPKHILTCRPFVSFLGILCHWYSIKYNLEKTCLGNSVIDLNFTDGLICQVLCQALEKQFHKVESHKKIYSLELNTKTSLHYNEDRSKFRELSYHTRVAPITA